MQPVLDADNFDIVRSVIMKIKDGFCITTIEEKTVVSVDNNLTVSFNGIVILNNVGLDIWNTLIDGCSYDELIAMLRKKYNVAPDVLKKDVDAFLHKIAFALEEEDENET